VAVDPTSDAAQPICHLVRTDSAAGVFNLSASRQRNEALAQCLPAHESQRIIKGRPFEVGFECKAELYRKEHPYEH
jgi:hypothetical protein